ncbi:uncharacterized protein TNCV_4444711 [Trichonephila clavipes]|nr:uncharacterized protein TNCV_4444711 [Trichonephila clavipes]
MKCEHQRSLLKIVETDQAREEPDELMDINHDSESKFEKSDEHETGTLARNPRCSRRRRIDEADISTPAAVDQRAANCLEENVRSFTSMQSRCRSSRADVTFRRPLPAFRAVRCSSVHCF